MSRATFTTTDYEFAHGRRPRGVASWAFIPADGVYGGDLAGIPADGIAWAWGTYGDAKREVAGKWPGVSVWRVLS